MPQAVRVARERHFDEGPLDWSPRISEEKAVERIMNSFDQPRHRGEQFRHRLRGHAWSEPIKYGELEKALEQDLKTADVGDVVAAYSIESDLKWIMRQVFYEEPDVKTEGNTWIDAIVTYIFRDDPRKQEADADNWGICNRRPIAGSSTPSQHNPWADPGDKGGQGANAIDVGMVGTNAKDRGFALMNRLIATLGPSGSRECGKIIWWGGAWYVDDGVVHPWHSIDGIGHFDHLHTQGFIERSSWSNVRLGCP